MTRVRNEVMPQLLPIQEDGELPFYVRSISLSASPDSLLCNGRKVVSDGPFVELSSFCLGQIHYKVGIFMVNFVKKLLNWLQKYFGKVLWENFKFFFILTVLFFHKIRKQKFRKFKALRLFKTLRGFEIIKFFVIFSDYFDGGSPGF